MTQTFDNFDITAQAEVPKVKLLELAAAIFVQDHGNVIFYGPPGVGKTHCLLAIGLSACMKGYRTLFTTAASLLTTLLDAKRDGSISRRLKQLDRYALLLIDELGYVPFERQATDLLFQVVCQRYERSSIAITTKLAFEQWTQVFPDAMAASAVIDRLIHHGSVFKFKGDSHRLRAEGRPTRSVSLTEPQLLKPKPAGHVTYGYSATKRERERNFALSPRRETISDPLTEAFPKSLHEAIGLILGI